MIERTALEIALDLDAASCSSFAKLEAAEALRQQQAEVERLIAINSALTEKSNSYVIENARQAKEIERLKTVPMKYRRMAFNAQLQEENTQLSEKVERLTALNSALTAKANVMVIASARLDEKIDSLTAERDTAIAAAVAAEREACAAACRRRSESAGLFGSASAGALQCERDIRARSAT